MTSKGSFTEWEPSEWTDGWGGGGGDSIRFSDEGQEEAA